MNAHTAENDARRQVIRYVMRLIDYGKGEPVPEFDDLSLGDIADRIIACVTPPGVDQNGTQA